ncbi:TIR domain-containing protein [Methylobacter svalbardensis]|uniref:TIR domain-containing protein n=1 Tax=Methylobacter svalbardensis TaxID=3080016 RepID=UPI0030EBE672
MNPSDRKKVAVITKYVTESFSESDWFALGQLTGQLKKISDHPRLFRSMSFGDDDYEFCTAEVLDAIFVEDSSSIPEVIEHFDIDLWYQQKSPEKYQKLFVASTVKSADFWIDGYLKVFVSHLSSNRTRMSSLKVGLANWGVSAFIAHEDIEASREWRDEVEAGLESMDVLVAVVEPGFKESDWCVQEVGFALGRKIDIIPLRAGLDPFGFFGKYQGIPIKGKVPENVAGEITQTLLKKPQHRNKILQSMSKAFATLNSQKKIELISVVDSWSIVTDVQLKTVLEQASLSEFEQKQLKNLIAQVGAFKLPESAIPVDEFDDIPF